MKKLTWRTILLSTFLLSLGIKGFAQEETLIDKNENLTSQPVSMTITATRVKTPEREIGSSITVIRSREIEASQKKTVFEVLKGVPGLDVTSQGGPGGGTKVSIRGARSEHTLVLLDGMELNDPMGFGRGYDFAHLGVENIDRIEVLRGPQSTLYGTNAMGGVINIITKKGKGRPKFTLSTENGSFRTFRGVANFSGGMEKVNYSIGVSRLDSEGISSAAQSLGNHEKDGTKNTTISGNIGFTPLENMEISITSRLIDSNTDGDNGPGIGNDDPNHIFLSKQLFVRSQANLSLFNDVWNQNISFSLTNHSREDNNDTDFDHPGETTDSFFEGRLVKFDWQSDLRLHRTNTLSLGLETHQERGESDTVEIGGSFPRRDPFEKKTTRTKSFFVQDQIKLWDSYFATAGMRLDDHSEFGSKITYRFTSAYLLKPTGTKLKGTYGTAVKAPTLFELHSTSFGNPDLKPGESVGKDIGIEQSLWGKRTTLGVTYFENKFDSLIGFDSTGGKNGTGGFANGFRIKTRGYEFHASLRPINNLTVQANHTITKTEDDRPGDGPLVEVSLRPKNKTNLNIDYRYSHKGTFQLGVLRVGHRKGNSQVRLNDYILVNLGASFNVLQNLQFFGSAENLFNRVYVEEVGYGTPGVSFSLGLKLTL